MAFKLIGASLLVPLLALQLVTSLAEEVPPSVPSIVEIDGLILKTVLARRMEVPATNVLGTTLELTFPAGNPGIGPHSHAGPVLGYVVEGEFLFQAKDESHRILRAGDTFYEADRTVHIWGGNASNQTKCVVIATCLCRPDEPVTTLFKDHPRESYAEALQLAKKNDKSGK